MGAKEVICERYATTCYGEKRTPQESAIIATSDCVATLTGIAETVRDFSNHLPTRGERYTLEEIAKIDNFFRLVARVVDGVAFDMDGVYNILEDLEDVGAKAS